MNIAVFGYLSIEVIEKCNLNCDMCMRGESTGKRITRDVVEKIFDEVKYVETIVFTGGEVTLAYNEIKMILDVIKEKNVKVDSYQIIVNGTIYNKKLFDLLKNEFDKGAISISCDYYHDKSILEKYPNKLDLIMNNYQKIMNERDFIGFNYLPRTIINCGNAENITEIDKEEPSLIGFVTLKKNKNILYVGPDIAVNVDGYFVAGNNTYEINDNNNFGNILDTNFSELLLKKSIKNLFFSRKKFINYLNKLNNEYFYKENNKGYIVENKKIINRKRKVIKTENYNEELHDNSKRLIHKYQNNETLN